MADLLFSSTGPMDLMDMLISTLTGSPPTEGRICLSYPEWMSNLSKAPDTWPATLLPVLYGANALLNLSGELVNKLGWLKYST